MEGVRRWAAAAGLALTVALAGGCTRIEAEIEVRADGMVEVDASYWLPPEADGVTDACVWFNRQPIPGLEVSQLSQGFSRRGCRAWGTTSVAALESRHLVTREHDGTLDFTFRPRTRLWPAATPAGLDRVTPSFDVAVTFAGRRVLTADGGATIEGATVRWSRASSLMNGMSASARVGEDAPGWPSVALGMGAALAAGLLGGWLVARRPAPDASATSDTSGEEADAASAGRVGAPAIAPDPELEALFFARPAPPEDPSVWAPRPEEE